MSRLRPCTLDYGVGALRLRLPELGDAGRLALGDAARGSGARAARVGALIGAAYEGPADFDPERLSLVDRVAALFRIALAMGRWPARFVAACSDCGAGNALTVSAEEFDYVPATAYQVDCDGVRLMQPNGWHEARLERLGDLAVEDLALEGDTGSLDAEAAMGALAQAAPRYETALPFACSTCGAQQSFWFDPLDWIASHVTTILAEVHALARAYGWSEAECLAMPHARRLAYIALIEAGEDRR
jgi:hypothetical protein